MQLRRSILLALLIICFIYFEIHSCSKDEIVAPQPKPSVKSLICSATDVYFTDELHGWVVGTVGTLMRTTDGGKNWEGSCVTEVNLTAVEFVDAMVGWIAGKNGEIYKTADGGATWEMIAGSGYPLDENFSKAHFLSGSVGYVLGYRGVYKTENGGTAWVNNWLPVVPYRGTWDMSWIGETAGFLLGSRWMDPDPIVLYRTADGGATWAPVEGSRASVLTTILTIDFVDGTTGWAGGGAIMKTTDGGATWSPQVASATVREFAFLDAERGFAVGGTAILRTRDGGATWESIAPADPRIADLRGVFFLDAARGWVVGRGPDEQAGDALYKHSILLATKDGGDTWTIGDFPFDYSIYASQGEP